MRGLYLRFSSEKEAQQQLLAFGFERDEQTELHHPEICMDIVGFITKNIGDEESVEYVIEPGYHVNLRVINDDLYFSKLNGFVVTPKTPARVWA